MELFMDRHSGFDRCATAPEFHWISLIFQPPTTGWFHIAFIELYPLFCMQATIFYYQKNIA